MTTTVMLVDEYTDRAEWLREALDDSGYRVVATVAPHEDLYQRVKEIEPDVVIIEARSGKRDILEGLSARTGRYPRPVVLLTEHNDPELMNEATRAGVSPYVVGGLSADGVQSIINVAINQFHEFEKLRSELSDTRARLENQRIMEQAKCLLMEQDGLSENQAYHLLRKTAMEKSRAISEIAQAFLRARGRA